MSSIVRLMQGFYTNERHEKLKEEARPLDLELPPEPTLANPVFVPNLDYLHSLAGTIRMGAVGFDTFGMGSGHSTARELANEARKEGRIYSSNGAPMINTAANLYSYSEYDTEEAMVCNMLFWIWDNVFKECVLEAGVSEWLDAMRKSGKYNSYLHKLKLSPIVELFDGFVEAGSYREVCRSMISYITGKDPAMSCYTYNIDNDMTQDVDVTVEDYHSGLAGFYFHTGGDARCGFSSPVFATINDEFLMFSTYGPYIEVKAPKKAEKESWVSKKRKMNLEDLVYCFNEVLKEAIEKEVGRKMPCNDRGSYWILYMIKHGLIKHKVSSPAGGYYLNCDYKITKKLKKLIKAAFK